MWKGGAVIVTKLVDLSRKNILLGVLIKAFCLIIFSTVSVWNEYTGWLRTKGIGGKKYKSLKNYKDIHSGKRCFIIATGPSLTMSDLDLLKNEYTFGMNSIVKKYGETDFRPTYYGIQDHIVYASMEKEILTWYKTADNVFISDRIKWHSQVGSEWNVFPLNMSYHAYRRWFHKDFFAEFSDDIFRRVYSGFSITYSLIEIAVYMGFKEIYLIGADCSFDRNKPMHFAEHGVVDVNLDTNRDRNIAGYVEANKYTKQHGVKIFNATRGGELEVYQRVNLEDVLNK